MPPFKSLEGQRFCRLIVLHTDGQTDAGNYRWRVRCDCGTEKTVASSDLTTGRTRSCGCWRNEHAHLIHGHTRKNEKPSATFTAWANMIQRCTNPKTNRYHKYGGAGVKVCKRWMTFTNFLADMGEKIAGTSLGRILDMGDYEPGNVFWQALSEQTLAKQNHTRLLKWADRRMAI